MNIRAIYHHEEPAFPATDQHPDAARARVGKYWVDFVGPEPTVAQIEATLNPPKPVLMLDERLAVAGLTVADIKEAVRRP